MAKRVRNARRLIAAKPPTISQYQTAPIPAVHAPPATSQASASVSLASLVGSGGSYGAALKSKAQGRRSRRFARNPTSAIARAVPVKTEGWFGDLTSNIWGGIKDIGKAGATGAQAGIQQGTQNYVSNQFGPGAPPVAPPAPATPTRLLPAAAVGGGLLLLMLLKK
jgi:hypothetical protein